MVSVLLEYIDQTLPIMLALCLMLLATYYAQNYAGIIGWSLTTIIYPIYLLGIDIQRYPGSTPAV